MDSCVRSCFCIWLIVLFVILGELFVVLIVAFGQWAPRGRYSCIAQGASPGLIIGIHLLSPQRGRHTCARLCVVVMLYLLACEGKCRSLSELLILLFSVSPGFHIGLCPHSTLGYAGVSPFQGSLSYWLCLPRVPYRVLPSFHPGLCRSIALSGLIVVLAVCGVVSWYCVR